LSFRRAVYRLLMIVSLGLYVGSVLLPWLIEHGESPLDIHPPIRNVSRFWSFQVVEDLFQGSRLVDTFVFKFREFWFASLSYAYPERVYRGWLLVFVFHMLGVIAGAISVVKENVREKPIPLFCAVACAILSLVVCSFQYVMQSAPGRGYSWLSVSFGIGFFLALISTMLWLFSLSIKKLYKQS